MRLRALPGRYAVCRLGPDEAIPPAVAAARFAAITRTAGELSIVCEEALAPADAPCEAGWSCLGLEGPIPFTAIGVLASVLAPLAQAHIGIFAVSTFDTDYLLVKEVALPAAVAAPRRAGHEVAE